MGFSAEDEQKILSLIDEREIKALIDEYPRRYHDEGMKSVGELFDDTVVRMRVADGPEAGRVERDGAGIQKLYEDATRFYGGEETYTRIYRCQSYIEISDDRTTAEAVSYYLAAQAVPDGFPLQLIVVGQWEDKFERVDGVWKFTERYFVQELVGDESAHMTSGKPSK